MAGIKNRYLAVSHNSEFPATSIKNTLYSTLRIHFGELILSKIDVLEVLESYDALKIVIIRCNLDVYKYLCYVICTMGRIGETNVKLSIVEVSGILKKLKKKIVKRSNHVSFEITG